MKAHVVSRVFILALVLVAALASSSCDNSSGIGMTPDVGTRWGGGGGSGPPIFVGGPSQ